MKNLLEAQTCTIQAQNMLIQGLSVQVRNLQEAVDPMGQFADHPIMIEDDLDSGGRILNREESREVEIQEMTWTGGPQASVHTLYMISD
jgi:hypothetical protein